MSVRPSKQSSSTVLLSSLVSPSNRIVVLLPTFNSAQHLPSPTGRAPALHPNHRAPRPLRSDQRHHSPAQKARRGRGAGPILRGRRHSGHPDERTGVGTRAADARTIPQRRRGGERVQIACEFFTVCFLGCFTMWNVDHIREPFQFLVRCFCWVGDVGSRMMHSTDTISQNDFSKRCPSVLSYLMISYLNFAGRRRIV